ncbi:hypothetical protein CEXT_15121 [Caerostris extrusa]|uniref:Uncharacterized protein n=1 Tax=Caerostris extrusa TaxID=172846 RepID=A0AAV4MHP6_CAEEX|nr:hypothetical protein CEXT_15121 [Caerostris extrusa]
MSAIVEPTFTKIIFMAIVNSVDMEWCWDAWGTVMLGDSSSHEHFPGKLHHSDLISCIEDDFLPVSFKERTSLTKGIICTASPKTTAYIF